MLEGICFTIHSSAAERALDLEAHTSLFDDVLLFNFSPSRRIVMSFLVSWC